MLRSLLRAVCALTLALGFGLLHAACTPAAPPPMPATPESAVTLPPSPPEEEEAPVAESLPLPEDVPALQAEWQELLKAPILDMGTAVAIAEKMRTIDPANLEFFYDILKDPNADPRAKMFIAMTLTYEIKPETVPRLIELTGPDQETTTRAVSSHLLGQVTDQGAVDHLRKLADDPELRVAFSALVVLLAQNDPVALGRIEEFFAREDMTQEMLDQLAIIIPQQHIMEHVGLYEKVLPQPEYMFLARQRAIEVLYRAHTPETRAVLEKVAADDPDAAIQNMAKQAVEYWDRAVQEQAQTPTTPLDAATAPPTESAPTESAAEAAPAEEAPAAEDAAESPAN